MSIHIFSCEQIPVQPGTMSTTGINSNYSLYKHLATYWKWGQIWQHIKILQLIAQRHCFVAGVFWILHSQIRLGPYNWYKHRSPWVSFSNFHCYTSFVNKDCGAGKWLNARLYVLVWSVIGRLMVRASCLLLALTPLKIHLLSESHRLVPASAANWFKKKLCHVLSCLCDNACEGSLAICRNNRALHPVSRLLSVPI